MKRAGRYFDKAEFAADWPVQFLILVTGILLSILEGSLGLWPIFHGATPLLTLIFLSWMVLHYAKFISFYCVFIIGIVSDLLFSDLLGGRALVYLLAYYYITLRRAKLLQNDFMQIWLEFTLVAAGALLIQLLIFSLLFLTIPATTPILFQLGTTIILFPVSYVMLFSVERLILKVKMLS